MLNDIIFGASLSEAHIDELAVKFVCIQYVHISVVRHARSHLRLLFWASCIIRRFKNYSQTIHKLLSEKT